MNKHKLLVIDDSTTMYKIIAKNLSSKGISDIDYAPDGNSAIKIASVKKYDLITVDIGMPGISGFKTVEEIMKITPEQKFLFISSQSSYENKVKAEKLGITDFLAKPFNPDALIEKVFAILGI